MSKALTNLTLNSQLPEYDTVVVIGSQHKDNFHFEYTRKTWGIDKYKHFLSMENYVKKEAK